MMRAILLWFSRQKWLKNFFMKFFISRAVVRRFVCGEELEDAIQAVKNLNQKGLLATIDHLGEEVTNWKEAEEAAQFYHRILEGIDKNKVNSNASLKLTQMGLKIDFQKCQDSVEKIVQKAKSFGNFIRIDMEGSDVTQKTLELFYNLRKKYDNVGIVIQAYLYRSEKDVEDILNLKARIRLCKGAYKEPASIAFPKKKDVDANFAKLTKILLKSGVYHGIATHDEKLIDFTKKFAQEENIPKESFEFQLLYGIRSDLQESLVKEGYNVRVYVPYGKEWYPYFMRRLAERPANLFFLLKNFCKR
jgi:proline dehydrogenase